MKNKYKKAITAAIAVLIPIISLTACKVTINGKDNKLNTTTEQTVNNISDIAEKADDTDEGTMNPNLREGPNKLKYRDIWDTNKGATILSNEYLGDTDKNIQPDDDRGVAVFQYIDVDFSHIQMSGENRKPATTSYLKTLDTATIDTSIVNDYKAIGATHYTITTSSCTKYFVTDYYNKLNITEEMTNAIDNRLDELLKDPSIDIKDGEHWWSINNRGYARKGIGVDGTEVVYYMCSIAPNHRMLITGELAYYLIYLSLQGEIFEMSDIVAEYYELFSQEVKPVAVYDRALERLVWF